MSQQRPPQTAAWIALDRVHSLMSRQIQATMTEHDVTRPQYSVLRLLLEEGEQTANALSSHMGVTPGNLTGVIDRLEAAGLVQRERDPQDRRCVTLRLTEAGSEKARSIIPSTRGRVERLFAALNPQELEAFRGSLKKLEAALDTEEVQPVQPQAADVETAVVS
ncbi:MarR family transcriptional regulator [Deinococcus radiomollis]|uniref:MarR family winged helix-turn-helix transcriptional regulator n=1 Tax=Deinococcus radiomollis TaxID=468916 RepID=UPI0038923EBB